MIMIGVILLLLNALFVVIDVKNNRIRKGTLMNAFAAGCVLTTLVHVL
jgi:hypothetical protein